MSADKSRQELQEPSFVFGCYSSNQALLRRNEIQDFYINTSAGLIYNASQTYYLNFCLQTVAVSISSNSTQSMVASLPGCLRCRP